jgi:hypothetical protein
MASATDQSIPDTRLHCVKCKVSKPLHIFCSARSPYKTRRTAAQPPSRPSRRARAGCPLRPLTPRASTAQRPRSAARALPSRAARASATTPVVRRHSRPRCCPAPRQRGRRSLSIYATLVFRARAAAPPAAEARPATAPSAHPFRPPTLGHRAAFLDQVAPRALHAHRVPRALAPHAITPVAPPLDGTLGRIVLVRCCRTEGRRCSHTVRRQNDCP